MAGPKKRKGDGSPVTHGKFKFKPVFAGTGKDPPGFVSGGCPCLAHRTGVPLISGFHPDQIAHHRAGIEWIDGWKALVPSRRDEHPSPAAIELVIRLVQQATKDCMVQPEQFSSPFKIQVERPERFRPEPVTPLPSIPFSLHPLHPRFMTAIALRSWSTCRAASSFDRKIRLTVTSRGMTSSTTGQSPSRYRYWLNWVNGGV